MVEIEYNIGTPNTDKNHRKVVTTQADETVTSDKVPLTDALNGIMDKDKAKIHLDD